MNYILASIFLVFFNSVYSQPVNIDTIDFYDLSKFEQSIIENRKGQIDYVSYKQKNGSLKMQDFYDIRQRIVKKQVWGDSLLQEIKYTYYEENQVIKSYDVLKDMSLPTEIKVQLRYPAMARENGIEGTVEVAFKYNDDCVPLSFEALNSLSKDIDKEVEKKMKLFLKLSSKYNVSLDGCLDLPKILKFHFKLN